MKKYALSLSEKEELLKIARQSIEQYLLSGSPSKFETSEKLTEPGAAFVTLRKKGELRGCIGHTVAIAPLCQTVSECAVEAAVHDPRFLPVRPAELAELDLEISVLTPLEKTGSIDEIEVGEDGLMIVLGRNRGLLLPQVATEYGWDRTQFLEQTCRKAGLPADAYKRPNVIIYRFQALVFGEKETLHPEYH